jgi:glycerophosphoryl diester phosphodiesterase
MITLGELCDMVAGRVALVIEVKSRFDGDRKLVARVAEVLASYRGPAVAMSFDPDQVTALKDLAPHLVRGIVAQRRYDEDEWTKASVVQRHQMTALRHGFRTQPHFIAYRVDDLPAPAPWVARKVLGCPLLTWTVRNPAQRARAAQYADQMIFEGFVPES